MHIDKLIELLLDQLIFISQNRLEEKMKEIKIIVNPKIASFLMQEGFMCQDIKAHRDNPQRSVFKFINSKYLNTSITDYINMYGE